MSPKDSLASILQGWPTQWYDVSPLFLVQEQIYGYVGWIFAQHFLNRLGGEYNSLASMIDKNNTTHVEVLSRIKKRLRSDTFTREYILDCIQLYPELVKLCYINFAMTHYINPSSNNDMLPSLSYQRIQSSSVMTDEELLAHIRKTVASVPNTRSEYLQQEWRPSWTCQCSSIVIKGENS